VGNRNASGESQRASDGSGRKSTVKRFVRPLGWTLGAGRLPAALGIGRHCAHGFRLETLSRCADFVSSVFHFREKYRLRRMVAIERAQEMVSIPVTYTMKFLWILYQILWLLAGWERARGMYNTRENISYPPSICPTNSIHRSGRHSLHCALLVSFPRLEG
jgi:hypothetical protein